MFSCAIASFQTLQKGNRFFCALVSPSMKTCLLACSNKHFAVINVKAFLRRNASNGNGQLVNLWVGLSEADIAGADKAIIKPPQSILLKAVNVQFFRFVV